MVRSLDDRRAAVATVVDAASGFGLGLAGAAPAGVPGPKGNREVFVHLRRGPAVADASATIEEAIR